MSYEFYDRTGDVQSRWTRRVWSRGPTGRDTPLPDHTDRKPQSMNAVLFGKTVLAGFDRGRAKAIARTRALSTAAGRLIYSASPFSTMQTRLPARGRPGRLARRDRHSRAAVSGGTSKIKSSRTDEDENVIG